MKRSLRRVLATLAATVVATVALVGVAAAPASAAYGNPACPTSQPAVFPQSTWQFFHAHRIVVVGKVCKLLGPLTGLVFVDTPGISLPTTYPGGGVLEQVSVTAGPYVASGSNTRVVHRFDIKQTVLKISGHQTFTFDVVHEISGYTYRMRICVLNGGMACNNWTTF